MRIATAPCRMIANTGTRVRGWTVAIRRKNSPSSAIAKYTRGAVSMLWLRKPSVETVMPSAMNAAPCGPSAARITSVVGVALAASPAGPSAWTQT